MALVPVSRDAQGLIRGAADPLFLLSVICRQSDTPLPSPGRVQAMNLSSIFHPAVAAWFSRSFAAPTAAQAAAWPAIQAGEDGLIAAPTGAGKTLAAFLSAVGGLGRQGLAGGARGAQQILYRCPPHALSND